MQNSLMRKWRKNYYGDCQIQNWLKEFGHNEQAGGLMDKPVFIKNINGYKMIITWRFNYGKLW